MVNVVYSPSTRWQSALSATQHRTSPITPPPPPHGPLTAGQNRAVMEEWPASGSARSLERTEATTGTRSSPLEQQPVDTVHSRGRTTTDISTHFVKAIVQTSASWNQTSACWNQTSATRIQNSARWKQTSECSGASRVLDILIVLWSTRTTSRVLDIIVVLWSTRTTSRVLDCDILVVLWSTRTTSRVLDCDILVVLWSTRTTSRVLDILVVLWSTRTTSLSWTFLWCCGQQGQLAVSSGKNAAADGWGTGSSGVGVGRYHH